MNFNNLETNEILDDEWAYLILQARSMGFSIEEIRVFLWEASAQEKTDQESVLYNS